MALLIKGIEMPKTAFECSTKINPEERRCNFTGKVFEETLSLLTQRRCADCPLVEIPTPHGRLIDETPMLRALEYAVKDNPDPIITIGTIIRDIKNRPTIIEAEE